jgi:hypothetical protein
MPVHGGRSVDDVCAGALERGGPRRGGVEPSSEAVLVEGALSPRVRRIPPEGAFNPRARRTPPEGARSPRARRTLLEGRSAVPPRRVTGATRTMIESCACFRFVS